jgi:O-antigen/teichoic acid export membrane protein
MQVKQIFLNTIWFGIVPKLSILITVFIMPLITPYLTAADYGILGIVTSYSSIFFSFYTLGLNVHLTNSYYEYKNKFYLIWGRILFLLLISGIICTFFLSIILFYALQDISNGRLLIIIILVSSPLIFGCNSLLANHLYPLRYDPKKLVLPILLSNVIGILASFVLIRYFNLGYIGLLFNGALASILTFLFFLKPLWIKEKIVPIVEKKITRIKELLKISIPVIPHTLGFMLLASSDRIIMNIYNIPINQIGYYTNGYSMGDYITVVTAALITALSPKIQELYRSNNYLNLRKVYLLSQGFTMIAVFLFAMWMPDIYKLLIRNSDLQQSSSIASLICFSNIIFPLYAFLSTVAFIEKKTTKLLWLVFVPGILNIMLNLIFIPIYGYKAAVYTTLISYWSLLIIPLFVKFYSDFLKKIFNSKIVLLIIFILFVILITTSNYFSTFNFINKFLISITLSIVLSSLVYKKRKIIFDF